MKKIGNKKTCDICGGSGQLSFFKGVSRFLLSTEECSECAGTGHELQEEKPDKENRRPARADRGKQGKRRK